MSLGITKYKTYKYKKSLNYYVLCILSPITTLHNFSKISRGFTVIWRMPTFQFIFFTGLNFAGYHEIRES